MVGAITQSWDRALDQVGLALVARAPWLKALSDALWAERRGAARPDGRPVASGSRQARPRPRPPADVPVPLLELLQGMPPLPVATAVLGLAEDGRPVVISLADEGVGHVLISGDPGAGKSTLLRAMILSLAGGNRQAELQFVAIDGQAAAGQAAAGQDRARRAVEAAWTPFSHLPHALAPVIGEAAEASDALEFLGEELAYRLEQGHSKPRIVVAIDDLDEVMAQASSEARSSLQALAQSGAAAGLHLLVASRDPASLDNVLRANLGLRLVGRMAEQRAAHAALGPAATTAAASDAPRPERLLGRGDFLALVDGASTRFQAAAISQPELAWSLTALPVHPAGALLAAPFDGRTRLERPAAAPDGPQEREEGGVPAALTVDAPGEEDEALPF